MSARNHRNEHATLIGNVLLESAQIQLAIDSVAHQPTADSIDRAFFFCLLNRRRAGTNFILLFRHFL
jgi:hypothetical protein